MNEYEYIYQGSFSGIDSLQDIEYYEFYDGYLEKMKLHRELSLGEVAESCEKAQRFEEGANIFDGYFAKKYFK